MLRSDSDENFNSKETKKQLIHSLLKDVSSKKKAYKKKMMKFKKINDAIEVIVTVLGAVAVSNLIATIAVINPITLLVGAVFASVSTIGGAVHKVYDLRGRYESCKTTYNQLSDLERESRAVLVKNHLESRDYQTLLDDINNRLSLIDDSSLPIKIRK